MDSTKDGRTPIGRLRKLAAVFSSVTAEGHASAAGQRQAGALIAAACDEIEAEMRSEREACAADLAADAARYSGTSEGDIFARFVLSRALAAVRAGQAERAGACGKTQECGGGCALPVGHAPPCRCGGDDGDGCPA